MHLVSTLTLKVSIMTAADNNLEKKINFLEKIRLDISCQ